MSKMSRHPSDTKVYVGELGNNASKQELEDAFGYYGHLRSVWVARNPPGFAFVEFEDPRDAEDAVRALDGRTVCGRRARVELSNGRSGRSRGGGGGGGGGGGAGGRRGGGDRGGGRGFHPEDKCYECGDRGHYARDCTRSGRRGGGGGGGGGGKAARRSRSRSNSRSSSRSRGDRRSRSASRSVSPKNGRSRSPSPPPRRRDRSVSRSDRSRSRNGD